MPYLPCFAKWAAAILLLAANMAAPTCVEATEPPKTALLVAVGDYPTGSGWQKISSLNDVSLLKKALLKQGFQVNEIYELTDQSATRAGIVRAIREYLVATAKAGGVAYFHFSGHGQQVADQDGDELDGFDEAIVPFDSPMNFQAGVYEGENLLRDDELGQLLNEVRRKLGPTGSLQVVLDACHSGTGTRGIGLARGTQIMMASPAYQAANQKTAADLTGMDGAGAVDESALAPMVAFFGAAPHQLNFEARDEDHRGVGSLSYAFSKKLAAAMPTTTYRGLFEQIRLEMSATAPSQNPQVEGPLDREIMGGRMLGAPDFYRVVHWDDPGSLRLEAGWLHGLQNGAVIGFFPPETRSIAGLMPLAKGTVTQAGATSSLVSLEGDLDQAVAMGAWAFVLEQGFGDLSISFQNLLPEGHPLLPILRSRLKKLPVINAAEPAELSLGLSSEGTQGAAVQLLTSGGIVIEAYPNDLRPELLADRIVRQVLAYGQARFLKNLALESNELAVGFEVIPVQYDARTKAPLQDLPKAQKLDKNGTLHLLDGDTFRIKVVNHGLRPAYFTLLDIQPDHKINVLVPMEGSVEMPAEFVVQPGSSFDVPKRFVIGPPFGTEVFKLIATDQPIDLRPVAQSRGQAKSASQNPFERVFAATFFNEETGTRGGRAPSMSATEVHVASLVFVIDGK